MIRAIVAALAVLLVLPIAASAEEVGFATVPVGQAPPGFVVGLTGKGGPSHWAVLGDPTASGGKALAQLSQEDRAAGIAFRLQDADNYYVVRANVKAPSGGWRCVATDQLASFHGRADFINPEFREALLAVAGDGGAISGKRLGKWLSANQGRIVNTMRITPDGIVSGISRWRLRGSSDEAAQSMPHASNIRRFPHHQG